MRVKIGARDLKLTWQHILDTGNILRRDGVKDQLCQLVKAVTPEERDAAWAKFKGATLCHLWLDGQLVCYGLALCVRRDNFSRDIGRRLSMQRALELFLPDHNQRVVVGKMVWQAYMNRGKAKILAFPAPPKLELVRTNLIPLDGEIVAPKGNGEAA